MHKKNATRTRKLAQALPDKKRYEKKRKTKRRKRQRKERSNKNQIQQHSQILLPV